MSDEDLRVREDRPAPHVARIALSRAEQRNAQDTRMLYELGWFAPPAPV